MTPAEIAAVRIELGRCRQQADEALGTAMQLLDRIERDARKRSGAPTSEASFGFDLDHPLPVSDCEQCGFAWQACCCEPNGGRT